MHVVNVVETRINQLLGVAMQRKSLRDYGFTFEHALVIINRDSKSTLPFLALAEQLEFDCQLADPVGENPFMNKWASCQVFSLCEPQTQVALWDWDVVCVGNADWPELSIHEVSARRNPVEMYRTRCLTRQGINDDDGVTQHGDVPSSINAGLLFGTVSQLQQFSQRHIDVFSRLAHANPDAADWELEQLAASIAIGHVGWNRLDDRWNVTPHSPCQDLEVIAWHYNDGHAATRRIKNDLLVPNVVRACCGELEQRWPNTIKSFLATYEECLRYGVFQPFIR